MVPRGRGGGRPPRGRRRRRALGPAARRARVRLRGRRAVDPGVRGRLPHRRRRAVAAAGGAHGRGVLRRRGVLTARDPARQVLRAAVPGPRDRVPGRLRRARPRRVLRVLRPVDRRDVRGHRDLGARRGAAALGAAVLPLHLPRLAGHAARVHLPRGRGPLGHLRHPGPARRRPARRPGRRRGADARGDRRRARDQDPGVAVPHVAPARPHRRPGGGLRGPRRGAAEDGHLRVRPRRDAAAAGRLALRGPRGRRARGRVGAVGRARRPRPARPQADDRLHVGEPHGVRRARRRGRGHRRRRGRGALVGRHRRDGADGRCSA